MSIQDWAAIGEIVGAIVVVVTLIYLAAQIRDSNRERRAATVQATLDSDLFLGATIARHAGTWDKVLAGLPLESGKETRRALNLYNLIMIESENRHHQFNSGYLSAQIWEGRLASLRPIVVLPMFEEWKKTPGGLNHTADFLDLLHSLRDGGSVE